MPEKMQDKKSSHIGAGLVAGAILGVAAALFLQSQGGKKMTKTAKQKALKFQNKLMQELKNVKTLTKEKYTELVEEMLRYYLKTQEVARQDIPDIRQFLLQKWSHIEKQFKSLRANKP